MSLFKNTLVIIPARGGSKRIPRKNVREISGQPMIYWPLMELSKLFHANKVIVSTDDQEICSVVEKIGLNVPFKRPKKLSDDYTGTMPVATHALNWFESKISKVDYVVIVYPTAVLLSAEDISSALGSLSDDPHCDIVMSATNFSFPIQRALFINEKGYADMFSPKHYLKRSQDLVEYLHDAGQFYICRADYLRSGKSIRNSNLKLHMLHKSKVIDIDTKEDFDLAEEKIKLLGLSKHQKGLIFNNG